MLDLKVGKVESKLQKVNAPIHNGIFGLHSHFCRVSGAGLARGEASGAFDRGDALRLFTPHRTDTRRSRPRCILTTDSTTSFIRVESKVGLFSKASDR